MSIVNIGPDQSGEVATPALQFKPATDELIASLWNALADRQQHDHPQGGDLFCLNLTSFMGERMGPVLSRLRDVADENDQLRAELENYRIAVLHMLALAPDEYRQCITAARASMTDHDYGKNNGRAEMIRVFTDGLASRAGLPAPDWELIKTQVPSDGVYRDGAR